MKINLVFFILLLSIQLFSQYHEQISVEMTSANELGYYYSSETFDRRFRIEGEYKFANGLPAFYKSKKVKRIEIYDLDNRLNYECNLDTAGKIIDYGFLMKNYFLKIKTEQLKPEEYYRVIQYFQDGELVKKDSNFNYYKEFKNFDTSFYFSVDSRFQYMRGDLINAQNRYYNERYFNKNVDDKESSLGNRGVFSMNLADQKYYTKPFKADYDSLKLYLTEHILYAEGFHHYDGKKKLEWSDVQDHHFFRQSKDKSINDYYVDGAEFNEPVFTQERMWCGNSLNRSRYDDGNRFFYGKNAVGLQDTLYVDHYPIDPNPEPPVAKDSSTQAILYANDQQPARLSTPIRTPKLYFKYEYFPE